MMPPRFDEATTSVAERVLYFRLQDHLDDDWTVIHSLPWLDDSRPRLKEGECDFLLLHPRYGLLVLEAKSGTPRYDGRRREWRYDDGKPITDPFYQANKGMHYIVKLLKDRSSIWRTDCLPFGCSVAFPDARRVIGDLRPDLGADKLLLEGDLERLQAAVINLLGRFNPPAAEPNNDAITAALNVLSPSFRLAPAIATTIDLARRDMVRLTAEQSRAMEGLAENPRLVVRGGAGTGKTLLIVEQARRLAAKGRNVLVLCFNRRLGSFLQDRLSDYSDHVHAVTFHNFCLEILNDAGHEIPAGNGSDYWEKIVEAAIDALPDASARFDAILADEAQDFQSGWWLLIEEFLADVESSQFFIFLDDYQNIYGRSGELPFSTPEYRLGRNCRNTGPIAQFCHEAVGLEDGSSVSALPDGPAPIIHEVADHAAEVDAVRRVLHELVVEKGLDVGQVAILGCHTLKNSAFATRRKLGNLTISDAEEIDQPNTVRYSTIHKFKGLEADCVLLTGIGEPSRYYGEEHMRRFVYVGGSRARVILHVFLRNDGELFLREKGRILDR